MIFLVSNEDGVIIIKISDEWHGDFYVFLNDLKAGITQWIQKSQFGKKCYETLGRITIADLAHYVPQCFMNGDALGEALTAANLPYFTITKISGTFLNPDYMDENLYEEQW